MTRWQLQDAGRQLSRVIERARTEGPQFVTRNGEDVAVLLAVEEYRRLRSDGGAFKRFLTTGPNFELPEIERLIEPARTIDL